MCFYYIFYIYPSQDPSSNKEKVHAHLRAALNVNLGGTQSITYY